MKTIRAALEQRIVRANALIAVVDDQSSAATAEAMTLMEALHCVIDEHEKSILLQISTMHTQEKKQLADYKGALERSLQECDSQTAKLAMLATDGTKLMQAKADFEVCIKRGNQTLERMQSPKCKHYHIQGMDQLERLKEQIVLCGQYVKYGNPELEKRTVASRGQKQLELDGMCLNPADMEIVLDAVRSNTVSNSDFCFVFAPHQSRVLCTGTRTRMSVRKGSYQPSRM